MIVEERFVTFINSMGLENTPFLEALEQEALAGGVPIIRKEMQNCLKLLLAVKRPVRILEVGTAVGFSAVFMHTYNPVPCHIDTIENYEKRIVAAKKNFEKAGVGSDIVLLEGDAAQVLLNLREPYDMIFMDGAKGQYLSYLPDILRLLAPQGLLVSDNVLQDGDVIESRYAIERRNRTIHKRMRRYLYELTHHPQLVTAILPVGDGITVSSLIE